MSVGDHEPSCPADPSLWEQFGPILCLLVDWARDGVRFDERRHPLGLHGIAAKQEFEIEARVADFARLASRDSASTHAGYLFGLQFAVEKRLSAAALDITLDVENTGGAA